MSWVELHIKTTSEFAEQVSEYLTGVGALALTYKDGGDDAILEPPPESIPDLWPEVNLVALFKADQDIIPMVVFLNGEQEAGHLQEFNVKPLADENWERRCLDSFQPIQFGENLWVCPSWQKPVDANAINIIIDPGLAFGTGTHATTALCLEWLGKNVKPGMTLVDYGCGSGILALGALKLGAVHAIAIDYDPKALSITQENADANQIDSEQLTICHSEDFQASQQVDLVIANILAQPLVELAPTLANLVKNHGKIVLSGILREQAATVSEAYAKWFDMQTPVFRDEWTLLTGTRKVDE
jgi:ribosomal protein L11 methyltransferase